MPGMSRPPIAASLTRTIEVLGWTPQPHYDPRTGRVDIIGALAQMCLPGGAQGMNEDLLESGLALSSLGRAAVQALLDTMPDNTWKVMSILSPVGKIISTSSFLTRRQALEWTQQADDLLASRGALNQLDNLAQAVGNCPQHPARLPIGSFGEIDLLDAAAELCIPGGAERLMDNFAVFQDWQDLTHNPKGQRILQALLTTIPPFPGDNEECDSDPSRISWASQNITREEALSWANRADQELAKASSAA